MASRECFFIPLLRTAVSGSNFFHQRKLRCRIIFLSYIFHCTIYDPSLALPAHGGDHKILFKKVLNTCWDIVRNKKSQPCQMLVSCKRSLWVHNYATSFQHPRPQEFSDFAFFPITVFRRLSCWNCLSFDYTRSLSQTSWLSVTRKFLQRELLMKTNRFKRRYFKAATDWSGQLFR